MQNKIIIIILLSAVLQTLALSQETAISDSVHYFDSIIELNIDSSFNYSVYSAYIDKADYLLRNNKSPISVYEYLIKYLETTEENEYLMTTMYSAAEYSENTGDYLLAENYYLKLIELCKADLNNLEAAKIYIKLAELAKSDTISSNTEKFLENAINQLDISYEPLWITGDYFKDISAIYNSLGSKQKSIQTKKHIGLYLYDGYSAGDIIVEDFFDDQYILNESYEKNIQNRFINEPITSQDSAWFYYYMGISVFNYGDIPFVVGKNLIDKSLKISKANSDVVGVGLIYNTYYFFSDELDRIEYNKKDYKAWLQEFQTFSSDIYSIAYSQIDAGEYKVACDTLVYLATVCKRFKLDYFVSEVYSEIANIYVDSENLVWAEKYAEKALEYAEYDEYFYNNYSIALAYITLAKLCFQKHDYDNAEMYASEVLYNTFKKDYYLSLYAYYLLADIYFNHYRENYEGKVYAEEYLKCAQKTKDNEEYFDALVYNTQINFDYFKDIDLCEKLLKKASKQKISKNDVYRALTLEYWEAKLLYEKGNIIDALDKIENILAREHIPNDFFIEDIYSFYGVILKYNGNLNEALIQFEKSNEICDAKATSISSNYNHIGWIYKRLGDIDKALLNHEKAIEIQNTNNEFENKAFSLLNIGGIYEDQGRLDLAYEYYINSLSISSVHEYYDVLINAHQTLGLMEFSKRNYSEALNHFDCALEFNREHNDNRARAWTNRYMGDVYLKQGDLDNSVNYYLQAIELSEKQNIFYGKFDSHIGLANVYLKNNNIAKSKENALIAYNISKERNESGAIYACAGLMKTIASYESDWNAADTFLEEIMNYENKLIMTNFATMSEAEQNNFYNKRLATMNDYYSYILFRSGENPKLVAHAYNNVIKNKGILLKSSTAMRNAILNSGNQKLIDNYFEWIALKKDITDKISGGENIDLLEEKANNLEKELVRNSQEFSDFTKLQNIDYKQIQNELSDDEIAIEFIHFTLKDYKAGRYDDFTDSVLYVALLLTKDCEYPEMITLFYEHDLQILLGRFQMNNLKYINNLYGKNEAANTELYNLIWKPLEDRFTGINQIYYSPSGLLHKISLAALNPEKNVYLCDKYELSMQSSTSSLLNQNIISINNNSALSLFGGIDYNSEFAEEIIWEYLPGTKQEIEKISAIYDNYESIAKYSDKNASEDVFKEIAPESEIIHISTHGFFYSKPNFTSNTLNNKILVDDEILANRASRCGGSGFGVQAFVKNPNPLMRSGLVMAQANKVWEFDENLNAEDGVLTAMEVSHLDLRNTKLVVLSACETGLGDIQGSEGVYGLQRAFKIAGVDYIIMSLWKVADEETAEFMSLFYDNLIRLNDVKTAFEKTRSDMRQKYDPYYWAAFVLVE
jgi:CHAT domain-containing protein/tetratricopeptide (TPR) repeat protein